MPQSNPTPDTLATPPARSPSKVRRWAKRIFRLLVLAYLLFCLILYIFQRNFVFPGSCTPTAAARYTPPIGSTPLTLHTADGTQLSGLFCRAFDSSKRPTDRPADYPTILYFYGNGQVTAWALYEVDLFRRCGANVLLADYPGYGLSSGTVTEQGCYQTAEALWTYATNSPDIDPHRLIAVGWSLGGAMAIDLAQRHSVQGLVTVSAFTRIKTVAQRQFWFVPATLMLKYDFPNDTKLPAITCPTLIIHGTSDELVPYSMSNDLLALSPTPWKRHLPIPNAGHNDIFSTGYRPIAQALTQLLQQVNTTAAPHLPSASSTSRPSPPKR